MRNKYMRKILWVIVLLLAVFMLVAGFISGEAQMVFNKATNICMECIGLG